MKVVIVEDEKPAARRLSRMLDSIGIEVHKMLHSVREATNWFLNNQHPDLIMLDIQLSDGLSFEIFEDVDINSAVIFTTAYDEYALKAFKLNSIDYLLKPIDEDELKTAIEKYKANFEKTSLQGLDIDQLKRMLVNPIGKTYKKRFTVKVGQHLKMISTDDIVCFFSENKGTYIHTSEGRVFLIDDSLEQLETKIDLDKFFRINRKYFVNIESIEDIISYSNSRLKIKLQNCTSDDIIVSREKVKAFKKWLG
ncbi:MAG: LytTR family DNA-binding domain-containing protein [Bacteroidota bacterium]